MIIFYANIKLLESDSSSESDKGETNFGDETRRTAYAKWKIIN